MENSHNKKEVERQKKKKLSGASYRKKRKVREDENKKLSATLMKIFAPVQTNEVELLEPKSEICSSPQNEIEMLEPKLEIDASPQNEIEMLEPKLEIDSFPQNEIEIFETKLLDSYPQNEIGILQPKLEIDAYPQNEVEIQEPELEIDSSPQNEIEIFETKLEIDSYPQNEIEIVETKWEIDSSPQNEVETRDSSPQNEVETRDSSPQNEVESVSKLVRESATSKSVLQKVVNEGVESNSENKKYEINNSSSLEDLSDPGNWPDLSDEIIRKLVSIGPIQVTDYTFPKTKNRKFHISLYNRALANGDITVRTWLIYSKSKDAAFCFCCRIFSTVKSTQSLSSCGSSSWSNISQIIKNHENSSEHTKNFKIWKTLELDINKSKTTDCLLDNNMRIEVKYWKNVLSRLLILIKYLGTQSLEFRGTSDKLFEMNNGNFLKLVEAVGKFDLVLGEHLKKIVNEDTQNKYLSKSIQNELIILMANSVKKKIISFVKAAKYFSIIIDSSPDKSHVEQVSLIIRIVHQENEFFQVKEHFIGFLKGKNKDEDLTKLVLKELENLNISINNCRGQSYDNGSNMRGKQSDMQNRIKFLEPRAFLAPCSSHTINLVVNDSAHCSLEAVKFFDVVRNLYTFVSGSMNRWAIYKENLPNFTLKPLSETRWESKIDALKPLKNNLGDIYEALIQISEEGNTEVKVIAESLGKRISDFKFICSLLIWYDILEKVNIASKYLQGSNINLSVGISILNTTVLFLKEMRTDDKFEQYISLAENLALELEIPSTFPNQPSLRSRKRKRLVQNEILDPKISFKINFYFKILDQVISSISERLDLLKSHNNLFSFLQNIGEITKLSNLKDLCKNLELALTFNELKDLNGEELYNELLFLAPNVKSTQSSLDVLNYIYQSNLDQLFPNCIVAIKILNTLPVTVASGEYSFSKLNLIKTYLQTTMTQDRLVDLPILAIEKELVELLDYDDLVEEFAKQKARAVHFT